MSPASAARLVKNQARSDSEKGFIVVDASNYFPPVDREGIKIPFCPPSAGKGATVSDDKNRGRKVVHVDFVTRHRKPDPRPQPAAPSAQGEFGRRVEAGITEGDVTKARSAIASFGLDIFAIIREGKGPKRVAARRILQEKIDSGDEVTMRAFASEILAELERMRVNVGEIRQLVESAGLPGVQTLIDWLFEEETLE